MSDKDQNPLHSPNNNPSSEQNNENNLTKTIKQISPERHTTQNEKAGPKLENNNLVKVPVYKRQLHKAIVRRIPYFMSEQQFHDGLTNNIDVEIIHK